jgi:hypothetical protein
VSAVALDARYTSRAHACCLPHISRMSELRVQGVFLLLRSRVRSSLRFDRPYRSPTSSTRRLNPRLDTVPFCRELSALIDGWLCRTIQLRVRDLWPAISREKSCTVVMQTCSPPICTLQRIGKSVDSLPLAYLRQLFDHRLLF